MSKKPVSPLRQRLMTISRSYGDDGFRPDSGPS